MHHSMFGLHKQMRMSGQCVCEISEGKGTRELPSRFPEKLHLPVANSFNCN